MLCNIQNIKSVILVNKVLIYMHILELDDSEN